MSIQSEIITKLLATSGITDLVSSRIYAIVAPSEARRTTHLVLQYISDPRIHTHDSDCGLAHPRLQISSWATTYLAAIALATAVKAALNSVTGTVGSTTGCAFMLDDSGDLIDIEAEDESSRMFGIRQDYILWHQE